MIVGIAGGSGSGKTTVARKIISELERKYAVNYLQQDSYYIDRSYLPAEDREDINFDHPDSIDFELLINQLNLLKLKNPVDVPIYDFISHTRKSLTEKINPATITIVEGILLFTRKELIDLFDYKIYYGKNQHNYYTYNRKPFGSVSFHKFTKSISKFIRQV